MIFTNVEIEYLNAQRLGRLATIARDGTLQNNPVTFSVDVENGWVDVGGLNMGESRKFHNVESNPNVAFVVDDVFSVSPWIVRCLEIRGSADALVDTAPLHPGMSPEIIRIHPHRIISWGMGADRDVSSRRTIE